MSKASRHNVTPVWHQSGVVTLSFPANCIKLMLNFIRDLNLRTSWYVNVTCAPSAHARLFCRQTGHSCLRKPLIGLMHGKSTGTLWTSWWFLMLSKQTSDHLTLQKTDNTVEHVRIHLSCTQQHTPATGFTSLFGSFSKGYGLTTTVGRLRIADISSLSPATTVALPSHHSKTAPGTGCAYSGPTWICTRFNKWFTTHIVHVLYIYTLII